MSTYRISCGVGVLDGVLYAIGGKINKSVYLKSVEAYTPSSGVWTTIADMHFCRTRFGDLFLKKFLIIMLLKCYYF